jgi:tetratricopeptide (TPR) repeat protein
MLVHANGFAGRFVFDDHRSIVDNPSIRALWPPGPLLKPSTRPLAYVTFAINYAVSELRPWSYHATNLAIHLAASLVLLGIVRRTLARGPLAPRYASRANSLALAVALLWMIHPLQTQSVTYVVQRIESLMGLFYLLTLYCFIRSLDGPRRRLWRVASVAACALGMATKEVMVTAPVIILWYDRALVSHSWRQIFRHRARFYLALGSTWLILAVLMHKHQSSYTGGALVVQSLSPLCYALGQPGVILHYLRLCFWPAGQCLDYAWPAPHTAWAIIPPFLAVAVMVMLVIWCVFRRPALGFLGGWFFVVLAPTSSVVPIRDLAFEHRMYLPLAAVVTMVVIGGHELLARLLRSNRGPVRFRPAVPWAFLVLAALALGWTTHERNKVYHSQLAMWSDVVHKAPHNPRAHYNLAMALAGRGRFEEAIHHYHSAVRICPHYPMAQNNLGVLLAERGDHREAIRHYRLALIVQPDLASARMNLAHALARQEQYEEAAEHLNEALRIKPELIDYARAQPPLEALLNRLSDAPEA